MKAWPALLAVAILLAPAQSAIGEGAPRANDLGVYHTYDEMVSELQNLAAAHPEILRLQSIGRTYEGRDIWAVKLSDNVAQDEAEPNVTILGGIHAGELIGVEVALSILFSLVENYTTNATVGWYVNSTQIWFVPMINPDGHVYVEQGNQWRKNRSPNPGGTFGTDLNRNFGHLWGLEASHNPPDDDYCGPYAFSENETQAISRLVVDHPPKITISYHSYGQYILYPWGNTINQEPADPRLEQIGENMSLWMPEGDRYYPMPAKEMYAATGDTDDWFYANLSVLPFTIELSTSNRPLDSAVAGICADNYGPAMYALKYTVGAPPPPPPERSISLNGPVNFTCVPLQEFRSNFTIENTGDLPEDISIGLESVPEDWVVQIAPERVQLAAGKASNITLYCSVPDRLPAGETVSFVIGANSKSGANASARLHGIVGIGRAINLEIGSQVILRPGQDASIPVSVHNDGNAVDNISVEAVADTGWFVTQIPSPFELAPWNTANTFVKLKVPAVLPQGITRVNLMFGYWDADGTVRLNTTFPLAVETLLRLDWSADPAGVVFSEGGQAEVFVQLVNHGNVEEKGRLSLKGDAQSAYLDKSAIDLQPGESATVVLTLKGKPGTWKLDVNFTSDLGYPERQIGINYTIKARAARPAENFALLAAAIVLAMVLGVSVGLFIGRRRRRRRLERKGAP
jgi:hypothetical protein